MDEERDRIPALDSYHTPPAMPRARLWSAIEAADDAIPPGWPSARPPRRRRSLIAAAVGLLLAGGAVGYGAGRAALPDGPGGPRADSEPHSAQDTGRPADEYADASRVIVWF